MAEGTCCEDGCNKPLHARDRCNAHYRSRLAVEGRITVPASVIRGPIHGCWEWQGSLNEWGYAHTRIGPERRSVAIHRAVYEAIYGPFDPALLVCHKCDNPPCFRPDHLFLGDHAANMADMVAKGRGWGRHLLTYENVQEVRVLFQAGHRQIDIADRFGVSPGCIRSVLKGKSWGGPDLVTPARQARAERNRAMVAAYVAGETQADIARRVGLAAARVCAIIKETTAEAASPIASRVPPP